ncbi:gas vesicle protein GvpO [Micromonospora olivasterospora]|uniref:Gas vesicle protein GvpO n=2 Tax=Micromonospora olivasterospora TaxID=1880 RepID=A0A562IER6_MICOL|nr:gas vesicle protein GvpO [Micromonospora olivasterospora]
MDSARVALLEFHELTGLTPEGISGARPEDDGWSFLVDVTELERIPASSSVMATYRVDSDNDGHVRQYERLRRYPRNATDPT